MKSSILFSAFLLAAFFCSFVSASTIIDGWRYTGNDTNGLSFFLASASYFNNQTYVTTRLVSSDDSQLLYKQRDLHIALTSKTSSATGGSLSITPIRNGNNYNLQISTPANAGGVFTIVYDSYTETDRATGASLTPSCTSRFGFPVLLDSDSCDDPNGGGINLVPQSVPQSVINRDLTRSGTNVAFVLPITAAQVNVSFPVLVRIWGTNGTTSSIRSQVDTSALDNGQVTLPFGYFNGDASFGDVEALAIQFELGPGQNVTFGQFQAEGVSLVKNMILFDNNFDGVANPGEVISVAISISKAYLPINGTGIGWNFTGFDFLPDLLGLDYDSIQITADTDVAGEEAVVSSSGDYLIEWQIISPAGSPPNTYTITFDTVVKAGYGYTDTFIENTADLLYIIYDGEGVLTADILNTTAPRIPYSGAPVLSVSSGCPTQPLTAGSTVTITYDLTNAGSSTADSVVATLDFNPTGIISSYDPDWTCTLDSTNTTIASCSYNQFPNITAGDTESVDFTFTISGNLDCLVTSLDITAGAQAVGIDGVSYSFPDASSCTIPLVPSVNLSVEAVLLSGTAPVTVGDRIYYRIYYANQGGSPVYNVMLFENFPPYTTPVLYPSYPWVCNATTCVYRDTLGPLYANQSRSADIGLEVEPGFQFTVNTSDSFVCNQWSATASNVQSPYCSANATSNLLCVPFTNSPTPSPLPSCPAVIMPTTTPCPSYSPPPTPSPTCVYCLAGSTINISLKQLAPSGSCSNGGCSTTI